MSTNPDPNEPANVADLLSKIKELEKTIEDHGRRIKELEEAIKGIRAEWIKRMPGRKAPF